MKINKVTVISSFIGCIAAAAVYQYFVEPQIAKRVGSGSGQSGFETLGFETQVRKMG